MEVAERPKTLKMIRTHPRKLITPDPVAVADPSKPTITENDSWVELPREREFPPKLTPEQHPFRRRHPTELPSRFDASLAHFLSQVDPAQFILPSELPPALSFDSNPLTADEINKNCLSPPDRPHYRFIPAEPYSPLHRAVSDSLAPHRRGSLKLPMKVKLPPPTASSVVVSRSVSAPLLSGSKHARSEPLNEEQDCSIIANPDTLPQPVRALSDFAVPQVPFKRRRSSGSSRSSTPGESSSSSGSPEAIPIVGVCAAPAPPPLHIASELKVPCAFPLPLSFPPSIHPEYRAPNAPACSFSPPVEAVHSLSPPLDPVYDGWAHPEATYFAAAPPYGYNTHPNQWHLSQTVALGAAPAYASY